MLGFWQRYAPCFKTQTRDTSAYGFAYLSGQLRMPHLRNFAHIARTAGLSGQNVQHFMSNSPWSSALVIQQVQHEITATSHLADGILILDESAEKKAGPHTVGAARQWNGRLGKIDLSQVGTFLAYAKEHTWCWVDGELFLPAAWFSPARQALRTQLGIPPTRQFASKVELGWQMIQRVKASGLPFAVVACDALYGRSHWFRAALAADGIIYMADVPNDIAVYVQPPALGVPQKPTGQGGKPFSKVQVVDESQPLLVRDVAALADTQFRTIRVRSTARGDLVAEFAARRVWTNREGLPSAEEWLLVRRERNGETIYALSNAPAESSVEQLAYYKSQRYFIERANQDAKSELGWDELRAQKYQAWEHHLALTILASWFIEQTKLERAQQHARDPHLAQELGTDELPELSMANVREMLRAALPLPQLSAEDAAELVAEHLVNRARSRTSRLNRHGPGPST